MRLPGGESWWPLCSVTTESTIQTVSWCTFLLDYLLKGGGRSAGERNVDKGRSDGQLSWARKALVGGWNWPPRDRQFLLVDLFSFASGSDEILLLLVLHLARCPYGPSGNFGNSPIAQCRASGDEQTRVGDGCFASDRRKVDRTQVGLACREILSVFIVWWNQSTVLFRLLTQNGPVARYRWPWKNRSTIRYWMT